jgi:hypothetical protein
VGWEDIFDDCLRVQGFLLGLGWFSFADWMLYGQGEVLGLVE